MLKTYAPKVKNFIDLLVKHQSLEVHNSYASYSPYINRTLNLYLIVKTSRNPVTSLARGTISLLELVETQLIYNE